MGPWQSHLTLVWVAFTVIGLLLMALVARIFIAHVRASFEHMQSLQTSQSLLQSLQSYHRHTTGFPSRSYARADQAWTNSAVNNDLEDDVPTLDAAPFMAARDNAPVNGQGSAKARMSSTGNPHHDTQLDLIVTELALQDLSNRMPDLIEDAKRQVLNNMGMNN